MARWYVYCYDVVSLLVLVCLFMLAFNQDMSKGAKDAFFFMTFFGLILMEVAFRGYRYVTKDI